MDLLQVSVLRAKFAKHTPSVVHQPPRIVEIAQAEPVNETVEVVSTPPAEEKKDVEVPQDDMAAINRRFDGLEERLSKIMHMVGATENQGRMRGPRYLLAGDVRRIVSEYFEMPMHDLDGPSRAQTYVRVRHIAIYLCHKHTLRSMPEIGRIFGGRDHTTVLHGIRKVDDLRLSDQATDADLRNLEARLAELLEQRQAQ